MKKTTECAGPVFRGNPMKVARLVREIEDLQEIPHHPAEPSNETKHLQPSEEEFFLRAEQRGDVKVFRNGWPDFLLHSKQGGRPYAVEVKHDRDDYPRPSQCAMFSALELVGLQVFIWTPEDSRKLIPWRKFCHRCKKRKRLNSSREDRMARYQEWLAEVEAKKAGHGA